MKKLSREQKKIIYIALVALVFLFLAWGFIYLPQGRRLKNIQKRLKVTEEEISQINRLTQGKNLEEAVRGLNSQLRQAAIMLPSKKEDIIQVLSQEAKKLKIDIRIMDPADDPQVLPAKVPGFILEELHISMKLSCEYKAIGEYLDALLNKVPILIRVKELNIQGGSIGNPSLDTDLEISAYLSEPTA